MSIKTDNNLAEILETCGFSEKEQLVIAAMLSGSWRPAALIAKDAKLKRPTVYAILEMLIEYGVVIRKKRDNHALFSLISREMLPKIINQKIKNNFESAHSAVGLLADCLASLEPSREYEIGGYEVATFESFEVTMHHFEALLSKGEFCGIFNPEFLSQAEAKKVVIRFLKSTARSKPSIKELVVKGPAANWYKAQVKNPNHQVRMIAPTRAILTDMIFSKGEVLLFHYDKEDRGSIRIKHEQYYQSMMSLFEMLWERAE
jgi:sugar-specific transcriptional regulator TrmB